MKASLRNNNPASENPFQTNENKDEPDNFRKIFVGGISPVLTEDSLRVFYRQFGEIIDVKIMRDPSNNRPRGFGFITYVDSSCVDRAQAARPHVVDGKPVDSNRVPARGDAPKSATIDVSIKYKLQMYCKVQSQGDILRKLFLGGISPNSTEDSLRTFYRQFGEILDLNIMRDSSTGRSRGFGFVTFNEALCVDRAQAARPHVVDGKAIDSKRVLPPAEGNKNVGNNSGRKVFVGGLKEVHDELALKDHFLQYGNVLNIKILVDKNTGRRRGFGYIEFEDYDSADKAALTHNHTIKHLPVDVKKSTYKPETNMKFENTPNGTNKKNAAPAPPQYPTGPYPPPYGYPPAPGYNGWGAPSAPYPQQQQQQQPQWNGWGYSAPPPTPLSDNNYQQSYNGGPEKAGKLQGYRNKPYRV